MEEPDHYPQLLPPITLENAEALFTNPDPVPGQTEDFEPNRQFCIRPEDGDAEMDEIYGNSQDVFNGQSAKVVLILTELLVRCGLDVGNLGQEFQPNRTAYAEKPAGLEHLDIEWINKTVLFTMSALNSPTERFFSHIAFYRHIMAAMAPKREEDWQKYGANRFRPFCTSWIETPLYAPRYRPSVARWVKSDNFPPDAAEYEIRKNLRSESFTFGSMSKMSCLTNTHISPKDYRTIYRDLDPRFTGLLGENLPAASHFLKTVFVIQYWFIHIMPYHRGSAAVMNLIRYIFTAYYNYRVRGTGRSPLPVVPAKRGYFPDLEALLTCMTPEEFIKKSMTEIYCVEFSRY